MHWIEAVRNRLHAQLDRPLRVTDLAREAGVHRGHLGRVFRERFGETIGAYHRRIRLEWAAGELMTGRAVGDVAQRAGFADQAHFSRCFKQVLGMTPSEYRRAESGERRAAPV